MSTPTFVRILRAVKEQSVRYDASESGDARYTGCGNDRHMPIGKAANDDVYRGFLKFGWDWAGVYQIVSAVLVVKSTSEVHVGFGAGPTFEVQRCSEAFKEGGGSEDHWPVLTGTKAYPGAAVTGTTFTKGPVSTAQDTERRLDITGMAESLAPATVMKSDGVTPGGAIDDFGLRIVAQSEATTDDRYEIYGMRSHTARRPYIELTYIKNKPPLAPVITSPEVADPAYASSTQADRLTLDFLFSDPDASNSCILADVEVYGDAATDGAPGTRIAHRTCAPTALGPLNAYRVIISATFADSGQEMSPRTAMRYRLRVQDSDFTWGPWSPLADGRFYLTYLVGAPRQSFMNGRVDGPHIYGSLNSRDPDDHISAWEGELYRDTRNGAVTLWASGEVGIGGTSTRSDVEYSGLSLVDGERVRWRHRHANRDGQWGSWSGWLSTRVYAAIGPDAMTPVDTSTKLLTRTPTLTIAHSANFDGYRWRLYRDDQEIHDSDETTMVAAATVNVTVPAGLLAWGDGDDEHPLEWEAQIKLVSTGVYGEWSPRYAIRINALPGASVELVPAASVTGIVDTSDPHIWSPYEDEDKLAFNEWPRGKELELRETAAYTAPALPVAGAGALVTKRTDKTVTDWSVNQWSYMGRQLHAATSATDWSSSADLTPGTYGTPPTGYSGNSLKIAAAACSTVQGSFYTFASTVPVKGYGNGAYLQCMVRCTSSTNLTAWRIRLDTDAGANYMTWTIFAPGDSLSTWLPVSVRLSEWAAMSATVPDLWHIVRIGLTCNPSGSYTGDLAIRDIRIGTVQDAKDTPTGDLHTGEQYDLRVRYRDDATAKMSTTLAAASIAGATNVKVTSVTGMAAGDELTLGWTTGIANLETRRITTVGTAGSGGTGVTVSEGFTYAHANADTADVFYWGGWSGWTTFLYQAPPVVAASTPADGATINDPTQALVWTFTSALAQASAVIRVYRRTGTDDALIWEYEQTGAAVTYTLPPLLLRTGMEYAWEVEAFDTAGLSGTTTRRHVHTTFTPPAEIAGLVATTDDTESWVRLAWTASADTYLDHYRVYWRDNDGDWKRIDGGPERLGDGKTGEKRISIRHYGGRLGDNAYKVLAHNGAVRTGGGEPAYVSATLYPARDGSWMLVESTGTDACAIDVMSAPRTRAILTETYRPPGRGSAVNLAWGGGGRRVDFDFRYLREEDGDISGMIDRLIERSAYVWLKAPSGYGWDPFLGLIVAASDEPQAGGVTGVRLSLEEVDWNLAVGIYAWWLT